MLLQLCETRPMLSSSDPFDSHDDRDDDGEGESVEEHKSVIMHLLSQVRLGMDLTKVKTPDRHAQLRAWLHPCWSLCSVYISLTALVFYPFTHYNIILHSFIIFTGGPAYLHPRKEIFVGNVRRFLCTSRLICKVMVISLIAARYFII